MKDFDKIYAENLANEYAPKTSSKVIALKKLDRKAKAPANIFAYSFGIISSLVLGIGMCLAMEVIGPKTAFSFVCGIIIGLIGILGVSFNYFIYKKILTNGKEKYASDIIELAKKITDQQ